MATVWLWMTGLKHVPASSAGVFTVLLPVSAAAVGVLLLGEHFSVVQAAAMGSHSRAWSLPLGRGQRERCVKRVTPRRCARPESESCASA